MCYVSNQIAEHCNESEPLYCPECSSDLLQSDYNDYTFTCEECCAVYILNDYNELEQV